MTKDEQEILDRHPQVTGDLVQALQLLEARPGHAELLLDGAPNRAAKSRLMIQVAFPRELKES